MLQQARITAQDYDFMFAVCGVILTLVKTGRDKNILERYPTYLKDLIRQQEQENISCFTYWQTTWEIPE